MRFLMIAGAICFCIFIMLCIENMLDFKISKKRSVLFFVLCIFNGVLVVAARSIFQLNDYIDLYIFGFLIAVTLSVIYKSVLRGIAIAVYFGALFVGVDGIIVLSSNLIIDNFAFSIAAVDSSNAIVFIMVGGVLYLISLPIKKTLDKRIDISILNNRIMHFFINWRGYCAVVYLSKFRRFFPLFCFGAVENRF